MTLLSPGPLLRASLIVALLTVLASAAGLAQTPSLRLFTASTGALKRHPATLASTARPVSFTFDLRTFQRAAGASSLRFLDVPLARGRTVDMELNEMRVIAPGAVRTATTAGGIVPLPPVSAHVYRGSVVGDPASEVVLAISNSELRGWVDVAGATYDFGTDPGAKPDGITLHCYAAPLADYVGTPMRCGVPDRTGEGLEGTDHPNLNPRALASLPASDTLLYSVRGAFEGDYEYYQLFDSLQEAQDHMVALVGMVSAIYERDLHCQIQIGYQNIYTSAEVQPYTKRPAKASMEQALDEMRGYWSQNRSALVRGFAHCMSGKGWKVVVGIAYLNTLCENSISYSYSGINRTSANQDVQVVAHEIGHSFGSKHTHDCFWNPAIDSCTSVEGGECFGPTSIHESVGTVMSYCGQFELTFGPKVSAYLRGLLAANTFGCVEVSKKLTVSPGLIMFPEVPAGTLEDTTIADFFSNRSLSSVVVQGLTVTGDRAGDFTVVSPPTDSLPFTLEPGEHRQLVLHYRSDTSVAAQCTLAVAHDANNVSPQQVGLQGYSTDTRPIIGFATGEPKMIDFGSIRLGQTKEWSVPEPADSERFYRNVGAIGAATLHITATEIAGPSALEFQIVEGSAPLDIDVGAVHAGARFRYRPQNMGRDTAWLVVTSNSQGIVGTQDSVMLTGEARSGPLLRLSNNTRFLDFRERDTAVSYDTTFTDVFNAGTDTLTLFATISGEDASDYAVNTAAFRLAPGEGAELQVTLFTHETGVREAMLLLDNVDPNDGTIFGHDTVRLIAYVEVPASGVEGEEVGNRGLAVVPNPAHDRLLVTVALNAEEIGLRYKLHLVDTRGTIVVGREGRYPGRRVEIPLDISTLVPGLYTLVMESAKGRRAVAVTVVR